MTSPRVVIEDRNDDLLLVAEDTARILEREGIVKAKLSRNHHLAYVAVDRTVDEIESILNASEN